MSKTFIPCDFIIAIQNVLDKGLQQWFVEIFFSALTTCGTVSAWICNSNEEKRYRKFYHYVQRPGRFDEKIQNTHESWLVDAFKVVLQNENIVRLALDDSPIKRYDPKIEGAGYMYDPTNVSNKKVTCYGLSWVAVSLIVEQPKWGTISQPLRWRFYVPEENLKEIDEAFRPRFQTKLEIGEELVKQAVATIRKAINKQIQIAFDSSYVSEKLFKAMNELHVNVVTRFKSNTNFYKLPEQPMKAGPGRPRVYGDKFKLKDWIKTTEGEISREYLAQYGKSRHIAFKSMIVTTKITNGRPVRLGLGRYIEDAKVSDWRVFVSMNLNVTPQEILLEYSRRFSIEEMLKDLKVVCGLGSQEGRKWESCKACTTIAAMSFTAVEIETWKRSTSELTAFRPGWDDQKHRPSHKNKRDFISRKIVFENFSRNIIGTKPDEIQEKIYQLARRLGLAV